MDTKMKTFSAKPAEVDKKWVMIDADGLVVGRLASLDILGRKKAGKVVADYLIGFVALG